MRGAFICSVSILFISSGCASTRIPNDFKSLGLIYRLKEIDQPRPNLAHVLRIDVGREKSHLAVVVGADPDGDGPAETALTDPRKLADDPSVVAFVNTNPWDSFPDASGKKNRHWFEGQPVDIHGLAVSGGQVRSSAEAADASVWINPQGRVILGDGSEATVTEAVEGFQKIVSEGKLIAPVGGAVHPRTAIGVNRDGSVIWLVVVDGRQPQYSEGMNLHELGSLMLKLGCWDATNMDGGGSSIMGTRAADGRLSVTNSPSDRHLGEVKIRPLPMILTIRK